MRQVENERKKTQIENVTRGRMLKVRKGGTDKE
jgi:hypothetical protein